MLLCSNRAEESLISHKLSLQAHPRSSFEPTDSRPLVRKLEEVQMVHARTLLAAALFAVALPLAAQAGGVGNGYDNGESKLDVARRMQTEACYQVPLTRQDIYRQTDSAQASRSVEARTAAKPCYHNDALTYRQRM
jgi:hypothetical protein